jgi:hypothetical protein
MLTRHLDQHPDFGSGSHLTWPTTPPTSPTRLGMPWAAGWLGRVRRPGDPDQLRRRRFLQWRATPVRPPRTRPTRHGFTSTTANSSWTCPGHQGGRTPPARRHDHHSPVNRPTRGRCGRSGQVRHCINIRCTAWLADGARGHNRISTPLSSHASSGLDRPYELAVLLRLDSSLERVPQCIDRDVLSG